MEKMKLIFPSNDEHAFEYGKPLVIIGANGAGKTRFSVKIEELNDLNKKLEIINANIGVAETTNKAKTALLIAENKLNEAQPEGRKLKDVFEKAKAELKKKDDYTRKIAEIDAELEKYATVEKLQDSIKNDEKLLKENEGKQSVKEEEKELVIKNLTAIKSEHEAIKDVSGAIEKYKSDLEKAKAKLGEIKELSNDNARCIKEEEILKQAQEKYAKDNAAFMELQHIYEVQDQMFRDGQAGILAASLNEGDKCPVCGSTVHPDKARLSDSIPSMKYSLMLMITVTIRQCRKAWITPALNSVISSQLILCPAKVLILSLIQHLFHSLIMMITL